MTLKAGNATVDITPEIPMFLVGYPHIERISEGVHDPLSANALYLENQGGSLLMIAVDLLFLDAATCGDIRGKIAGETGLKTENIMISCTHTHSGPVTTDMLAFRNDPVVPETDPVYLEKLKERISAAGIKAVNNAKPAEIATASATVTGVGRNRHDPEGPRDPEAGIIVVRDAAVKTIKAISLIYCMHPTVLHEDSKLVSSDFPNYAREYLRSRFGGDITILYHTGPEGNLSPRYDVKGQTFAEAERLGKLLGSYVAAKIALLADADFASDPAISAGCRTVSPVRRKLPAVRAAQKNLKFHEAEFARLKSENAGHGPVRTAECAVFGAEETLFLARCAEDGTLDAVLAQYAEIEIQVLRIGGIYIAAFPGEMFVEYSLQLKKESPEKAFAICLANGEMQGYIVTANASGYEADNSLFMPETGNLMVKTAVELISENERS
ncbi:MAG: neutral/alkaline non-lysosomal ceramidase N-terminal domain-containing protein [Victivallaceae bacterium]|nr:neutral/alkaline non-lysosomal ceramidase N-terminal domain-containing protein [Victivallaceae bacterium]